MRKKKLITSVSAWIILPLGLMAWRVATPNLFVVGDSISIQYGVYLTRYLDGIVTVDRKRNDGGSPDASVPDTSNGGDSGMVLAYLKARFEDSTFKPDILMLNCGLHDIRKSKATQQHQVPIQQYENNLKSILQLVQARGIRMVWVRTTEVVDSVHNAKDFDFTRHASDVEAYNAVADRVFKGANVPVIDLHGFTKSLSDDRFTDHVHFNEETRQLQAAYLAGWLKAWLFSAEK